MTFKTTRKTVRSGNSVGLTFPTAWNLKSNSLVNVTVWKPDIDDPVKYEATLKVCFRGHVYGVHLPIVWGFEVGEMVTAEIDPMEMPFDGTDS